MSDDIVVLHKRAEVIMDTIYPTLRNYPKYEHGRLCNTLLNTCMELISLLGLAEHVKPKRLNYLQEAQSKLFFLKTLLDLSVGQQFISIEFHKGLFRSISTLNKGMIDILINRKGR